MAQPITVTQNIFIAADPERVWDYTQDYARRTHWDKSILSTEIVQNGPPKVVRIKARGFLSTEFHYKYENRPEKTTLAMHHTSSPFISGGGGSWKYQSQAGGTLWTQTNTILLKDSILCWIVRPLLKVGLRHSIQSAMRRAKRLIESQ